VAVVPIFVLWFGAGTVPAVLTAMIMCIFPIVVNVATGLAATEPELQDVMKTLRATRMEILWNVGLPRTMPYFFASIKVAATLAFVGTVISETVASNRGIGNLMMIASSSFDVPLVFAGLFILAALGVALYVIFSLIEGRVTGWAVRSDNFSAVRKVANHATGLPVTASAELPPNRPLFPNNRLEPGTYQRQIG
jgi:NitT/TauT family transport system permease protein